MMHPILAQFDGYTLRSVTDARDRVTLQTWIENDRFHRDVIRPEFFLGLHELAGGGFVHDPRPNCYALEDENGVLMFIRLSRAARVHIQFMPVVRSFETRVRTSAALVNGLAFLEVGLARAGAEEWIFDTQSSKLANLATAKMGFHASPHEYVKPIEYLIDPEKQEGPFAAQEGGA